MVVHTCTRCKKEFNKKSLYIEHINKKKQCEEIVIYINESEKNHGESEKNHIFNKKEEPYFDNLENVDIKYCCRFCNKIFYNSSNLSRHLKLNNCKVKKLKDEEKENIFKILLAKDEEIKKKDEDNKKQITELKENNKKMEDYIKKISDMNFELNNKVSKLLEKVSVGNINNGIINNNNINNVNNIIISKDQLCNFGCEDVTKIDTKLFKKIKGKTGKFIFRQCAENIFNNLPNNQTLYVSDLSRDRAMAFENGDWKIITMQKAIDTVTNQIRLYFKHNTKDAELLKDPEFKKEYDDYLVKYYKKYYDEYDKNDRYRPPQETLDEYARVVNEELKRFFYDIRNKVQNNYDNIKKQILDKNILKQIEYIPAKRGKGRPKTKIIDAELPIKKIDNKKDEKKEVKKNDKKDIKKEVKKEVKKEEEIKSAPFIINRKGKTYYRYDSDSDVKSFSDLE
jgi:hypothetical protein